MRLLVVLYLSFSVSLFGQSKLKLSDALREATANNPTLKSEKINVPIAESEIQKAKLYQNPIFNLQYLQLMPSSMYYDKTHRALNAVNSQDWFQLTKKFQVFGQRTNKIELAKLNATVVKTDFEEAKREVLYAVSLKWIDAWRAKAYQRIAEKAADYLDEYLKESFDSTKGKSIMKAEEVLRFQILDDQYDLEKNRAIQNYYIVEEELKLLIGSANDIEIDLHDTLETVKITHSLDSLLGYASENRQDLKSLKIQKEYSIRNERLQKSLAIPAPEAGFVWNPQNTIPYAGVFYTQTLPFFDRNQKEVQKAKLNTQMSDQLIDNIQNKLKSEVKVAFQTYQQNKEMAEKFKHNLNDSERLLQMVRASYLKNTFSNVDLWEAEQTWIQTYTVYYEAFTDYRRSYINLLYQLNLLSEIN